MSVFLLHGTITSWNRNKLAHRNYVPSDAYEGYLRRRSAPFAAWTDNEEADVLTIDDATRAGADACRLARSLGHEVIFFVNPFQVTSQQPYFFSLLDHLIDERHLDTVDFHGDKFRLTTAAAARRFRTALQAELITMNNPDALESLSEWADRLGAGSWQLEPYALPLTVVDLVELRDAGVQIENHGWSHAATSAFDEMEFERHVTDGRQWLRDNLSVDANLYAVPFGLTDVPPQWRQHIGNAYFLADDRRPPGRISPSGWNRRDLSSTVLASAPLSSYVSMRNSRTMRQNLRS